MNIPSLHISGADVKEESLPDARLSPTNRKTFCGPFGIMSKVYCINCGASGGAVTEEWAAQVVYVCDDCEVKVGKFMGQPVPDEVVRGQSPLVK